MSADAQNPVPRHRRRSKRRNVLLIVLALVLVGLLAGVVGVVYVGNLSRSFDQYWNNPLAYPVQSLMTRKEIEALKLQPAAADPETSFSA